ncbi:hypothetical protein H8F23_18915 [Pseudomonas sp. P155]|uniref:Stability determinant domain-containing protein n=1 Tax=Pseudomonas neuropathica TaxID=2730425 RepID=A0ABS0BPK1_9PSED|nr:hypothetical protein [Pseudomonas neuropathica]MBF6035328.1 hypothetical protein [Pseudomonas neuropathica]
MNVTNDEFDPPSDEDAYTTWFNRQVQASLDDPRPSIPDEVARTLMADKRARLKQKVDQRR